MKKITSRILVLVAVLSIFIIGCNKENENDSDQNTAAITAEKTNIFPYEIVTLKSKDIIFNSDSYSGSFDGITVVLEILNDTLIAFITPEISSGAHNLVVNIENKDYSILFNVNTLPAIDDPVEYLNEFAEQFNIPDNDPYYDEIRDSLNFAIEEFNNLTSEQQEQAVAVIAANREILDEINLLLNDHLLKTSCSDEVRTEYMKCITLDFMLVLGKLSAPVLAGALLGSAFSPLGTFVGGLTGIIIVKLKMKATLKKSHELWDELTQITFEPINAAFNITSKSHSFDNNVAQNIEFTVQLENVQNKPYSQGWLNNLIGAYNKFKSLWLLAIGNEGIPNYAPLITETLPADKFDFVSLAITGNNNITGTLGGSVSDMTLTFSSSQNTNQNFSFILSYNDGEFEKSTSEVTANLVVVNDFSLIGTWNQISPDGTFLGEYHHYYNNMCPALIEYSWAITKFLMIFNETVMTEIPHYHEINYDYVNLNTQDCSYSSVSQTDNYFTENIEYPYERIGNTIKVPDDEGGFGYIPFTFQGPDTLIFTGDDAAYFVREQGKF